MIAVPVPDEISQLFRAMNIPGKQEPTDHITLFYFEDDTNPLSLVRAVPLIQEETRNLQPFDVTCKKIISFPEGDDGYPIVGKIKSKSLKKLRKKISKLFDEHGIPYSKKFPKYKPHTTISYLDEHLEDFNIDKITWTVSSIALYDDDKKILDFPLAPISIEKDSGLLLDLVSKFEKQAS